MPESQARTGCSASRATTGRTGAAGGRAGRPLARLLEPVERAPRRASLLLAGRRPGQSLQQRHRGGAVPSGQGAQRLVDVRRARRRQRRERGGVEGGFEDGQARGRRVGGSGRGHSASSARKSGSAGHAAAGTALARKYTFRV